jgi:hypothetical protein
LRVLRNRVARLQGALDTIRQQESHLRAAAGMPGTDSATVIRRFLNRIPAFLRPHRTLATAPKGGATGSVSAAGSLNAIDWADTAGARVVVGATGATADSLADHALSVASGLRKLADGTRILRDTLDVFSLRPESLAVALATKANMARRGDELFWAPSRPSAIAAGSDAAVTRLVQTDSVRWELELRSVGGVVARVRAEGRPLVRLGEKVAQDQLVIVIDRDPRPGAAPVIIRVSNFGSTRGTGGTW